MSGKMEPKRSVLKRFIVLFTKMLKADLPAEIVL